MLRALQVIAHQLVGVGVDRHKALFAALATDEHVANTPTLLAKVFHPQAAHFRTPQTLVQHDRQDRPVPQAQEGVQRGCRQQRAHLGITQRWGFPFLRLDPRSLDASHRVVRDRIFIAEVVVKRGQGGEFASDGGPGELLRLQIRTPTQHVAARDHPKVAGLGDAATGHERADVALVRPAGLLIADVGKPLGFCGHLRQLLKGGAGKASGRRGGEGGGHHQKRVVPTEGSVHGAERVGRQWGVQGW